MDIQSSGQFSRIFIGYVRGDRAACGAKISLMKWYGMVWYGMVMVWCGVVWFGVVRYCYNLLQVSTVLKLTTICCRAFNRPFAVTSKSA
jgi:hypothetical protein